MNIFSSTRRIHVSSSSRDLGTRVLVGLLVAAVAFTGMWPGGQVASAQSGGFTPECNPFLLHKASISWTATERYLAAPDAPEDVVTAVTDVIEKVNRPDLTMGLTALDAITTPAFHEMTGLDCSGLPTPPAAATPSAEASPVAVLGPAYLDQVRQTDDGIVSAFLVTPGTRFVPDPDATPGSGASTPADTTTEFNIPPGYKLTDGVVFVVFVQQDGQWLIDYLSGGIVQFSDVVPNDEQLRKSGSTFTVDAFELRGSGMPAFPPDSTLVGTPEASPAG